jgi:flagellar assembly protein FliH
MRSWPDSRVLTPADAGRVHAARLDHALRGSAYVDGARHDARLLDPRLAEVVDAAARSAAEQGRRDGYAAGHAAGDAAASAEAARLADLRAEADERALTQALGRIAGLESALAAAIDSLEQRTAPSYDEVGAELGTLVCDLVETLLGRELETDRLHVVDAVRRAAQLAGRNAALVLHLHPDDIATVADAELDLAALAHRPVEVVADDSVERGGAVADSGARRIDAQLGAALDRLREAVAR